jgi:hypothetical protein
LNGCVPHLVLTELIAGKPRINAAFKFIVCK